MVGALDLVVRVTSVRPVPIVHGAGNCEAFLHEFSHSIFELADEYSGSYTTYFMTADEPNIFDTETQCQDEQTAKGRDPADCWQFTPYQTGWWGTHSGTTVMTHGLVTDDCPFDPAPPTSYRRTATWVDPVLRARVEIAEFTNDGLVRHASFVGLGD